MYVLRIKNIMFLGDAAMSNIVAFTPRPNESGSSSGVINMSNVMASRTRRLEEGSILPAAGEVTIEVAHEHAGEPIKSIDDINRVSEYLVGQKRYRDNMLFILGINFGLRISDLLKLQFFRLIDENCCFRETFPILEQKTSNTRKVQKNRYITINEAVIEAVTLYLQNTPNCKLDDYLFRSESNRGKNQNKAMSRMSADRILKDVADKLGLTMHVSTHTLRKTFGYHQMVMSGNDPRKLLLLQKIFGHSTSSQTLDYIGITNEEIEEAYLALNLGGKNHYRSFGMIQEGTNVTA